MGKAVFLRGFFSPPTQNIFYVPPQTQAMSLGAGRGTTAHKNTPKVCFRTGSKALPRAEITLWFTRLILLLSVGHNPSNPPCQLWSRFHNSKFPGVTADVSYLECVYIYTSRRWKHGPLLFLSDLGAAPPQGTVKILRLRDGVDWGGRGCPMSELWRKMPKMLDPSAPHPCAIAGIWTRRAVGVLNAPLFAGKWHAPTDGLPFFHKPSVKGHEGRFWNHPGPARPSPPTHLPLPFQTLWTLSVSFPHSPTMPKGMRL